MSISKLPLTPHSDRFFLPYYKINKQRSFSDFFYSSIANYSYLYEALFFLVFAGTT